MSRTLRRTTRCCQTAVARCADEISPTGALYDGAMDAQSKNCRLNRDESPQDSRTARSRRLRQIETSITFQPLTRRASIERERHNLSESQMKSFVPDSTPLKSPCANCYSVERSEAGKSSLPNLPSPIFPPRRPTVHPLGRASLPPELSHSLDPPNCARASRAVCVPDSPQLTPHAGTALQLPLDLLDPQLHECQEF
jgi:hypothetical protein